MIVIFSFQTYGAIRMKKLDLSSWTLINFFGTAGLSVPHLRAARYKMRKGSISGLFANEATLGGIQLSFVLSVHRGGAGVRDRRGRLQLHLQKPATRSPAWCWNTACFSRGCCRPFSSAIPTAPTSTPSNVWYVGNVNLYYARARAHPDRDGVHGGEAAVLAAHDQGGVLRHRRGAGGRGAQPGRERLGDIPTG